MNLQIQQEAADWFVDFRSDEPDAATRKAFVAWIRQSPEHLRAYIEMAEIWQQTPHVRSLPAEEVAALIEQARTEDNIVLLRQTSAVVDSKPEPLSLSLRNRALAIAASVSLLMLGGVATWIYTRQNVYATGASEQRTVALPDGSIIELNSRSRFRVDYRSDVREIELVEGQALFHVAKDPRRRFLVYSEGVQVRAVGTEFDVYRKSHETVVTVVEGRVAVIPNASYGSVGTNSGAAPANTAAGAAAEVLLGAGEQLTVAAQISPKPKRVDTTLATSWTQHKIVFKQVPLPDVLAELNRYSARTLRIQGRGLDDFRISGTYRTTDPSLLLQFLREQPGVTVLETASTVVVFKSP